MGLGIVHSHRCTVNEDSWPSYLILDKIPKVPELSFLTPWGKSDTGQCTLKLSGLHGLKFRIFQLVYGPKCNLCTSCLTHKGWQNHTSWELL